MKRAFTLIEVNLAMLIMAGGILSIVGLYSFGFRESSQSREDVASAALADAVLGPIQMVLSSTNLTWGSFRSEYNNPEGGWGGVVDTATGEITTDPNGSGVFDGFMGEFASKAGVTSMSAPTSGDDLKYALVIQHDENSAIFRVSFRAYEKRSRLFQMPLYYTEIRYQGATPTQEAESK